MKPISCRLHEYDGTLTHNVSRLRDRVDYYFYYDLTRMILPPLVNEIRNKQQQQKKSQKDMTLNKTLIEDQMTASKEVQQTMDLFSPCERFKDKQTPVPMSVVISDDSNEKQKQQKSKVMASNDLFLDPKSQRSEQKQMEGKQSNQEVEGKDQKMREKEMQTMVPKDVDVLDIRKILFDSSLDYHGKYGEFILHSPSGGLTHEAIADDSTGSVSNYQDIGMRIYKVIYIKSKRLVKRHATWFYGEPEGIIISRAYQEEDEDAKPAADVKEGESDEAAKAGEPAEPAAPAADADAAAPAADPAPAAADGGDDAAAADGADGGEDKKDEETAVAGGGGSGGGGEAAVLGAWKTKFAGCEAAEEGGEGEENEKKVKKQVLQFLVDYVSQCLLD